VTRALFLIAGGAVITFTTEVL